jgi:hypothetical protein
MSMKNSSATTGNQTRDVPAYSAVPQPTAPPRDPIYIIEYKLNTFCGTKIRSLINIEFVHF